MNALCQVTRKFTSLLPVVALASLGAPVVAESQVAWDTPLLVHPYLGEGWSVFVTDPHLGEGVSAMGGWRGQASGTSVGVRAGLGEGLGDDLAVFAGVDATGPITRSSAGPDFGVNWVIGAGFGVANDFIFSAPVSIVVGWNIPLEGAAIQPYAGPKAVLELGDLGPGEDDSDVDVAVDVGADFVFDAGWAIRFGGTVGDREGAAIGVQFPLSRE